MEVAVSVNLTEANSQTETKVSNAKIMNKLVIQLFSQEEVVQLVVMEDVAVEEADSATYSVRFASSMDTLLSTATTGSISNFNLIYLLTFNP